MIILLLAAFFRHTAGYCWAYNTRNSSSSTTPTLTSPSGHSAPPCLVDHSECLLGDSSLTDWSSILVSHPDSGSSSSALSWPLLLLWELSTFHLLEPLDV